MDKRNFNFIFLYFILYFFSLADAKLKENLFGINMQKLDDEYIRLFFDPNIDHSSQRQLSMALSAVQYCLSIDSHLSPLDFYTKKMANLSKKHNNNIEIVDIRKIFVELLAKIEKNQENLTDSDLCKLWDFEELLGEINNELKVHVQQNQIKLLHKSRVKLEQKHKCNELELENAPQWVPMFKYNLAQKHFVYLDAKLALETFKKGNAALWFGTKKIADESELSYRLRTLRQNDEFDKIMATKKLMEDLFMGNLLVWPLATKHPLTLSADVMRGSEFCSLVGGMFDEKVPASMSAERWLEFFIVLGKTVSYFRQIICVEKQILKIANLWVQFVQILDKQFLIEGMAGQIYQILSELQKEFGSQKMGQKSEEILFKKYAQNLLTFHHENETFRKKFDTQKLGREKIKYIFTVVDGHRRIMPKEFWKLFDAIEELKVKKPYLECPNASEISDATANLNTKLSDDENNGLLNALIFLYVGLMHHDDNSEQTLRGEVKVKENLEIQTALFGYKEMVGEELFGFADSLLLDTNFNKFVDNVYRKEWDKMTTKNVNFNTFGQNDDTKLCMLHKFAVAFVKDETLKKNAQWKKHLEQLLDTSATHQLNEPKLVLLLNDEDGTNWARADCSDRKLVTKFVESIKKVPNWSDQLHFYALSKMIRNSVYFQGIFCFGTAVAEAITMKHKLKELIQANAFHAIECAFPEILHFEMQLQSTYSELLLRKLEHKSATVLAQCFETRLSLPYIMQNVKQFENSLQHKLGEKSDDELLWHIIEEKIEQIKEKVYESIGGEKPTEWRKSACQLMQLKKLLSELLYAKRNSFSYDKIFHWEAECQTETELTNAFYEQRITLKDCHYMMTNKSIPEESERILAIPGAKTKLWKMVNEFKGETKQSYGRIMLWKAEELKKWSREVFGDNKMLLSHYDRILFGAHAPNWWDPIEQLLLADVIIFVRWMEEKLRLTRRSIATKRIEKSWETRREILEGIYDRISDEDEQTVAEWTEKVAIFFIELKQYMEKGSANELMEDEQWARIMRECFESENWPMFDLKKKQTYENWKQSLHREAIVGLIRDEPAFADRLKSALILNKITVQSKMEFVLGDENANEVLTKLNGKKENAKPMDSSPASSSASTLSEHNLDALNLSGTNSPITPRDKVPTDKVPTAEGKSKKTKKKIIIPKKNAENKNSPQQNATSKVAEKGKGKAQKEKEVKREKEDEIGQENGKEIGPQNPKIGEIFSGTVTNKDYVGITLRNFEEDHFLATKFRKFEDLAANNSDGGDAASSSSSSSLISPLTQLLHFGIYANEICHRLKLIKLLGNNEDDVFKQKNEFFVEIEKEWHQLKSVELSKVKSADKLIGQLFQLLKRIVSKMDNFEVENEQSYVELEEQIVSDQLKVRLFAKFLIEQNEWSQVKKTYKIAVLSALLGAPANAQAEKRMMENFEMILNKFSQLDAQRKLDKILFDLYKKDEFLANSEGKLPMAKMDDQKQLIAYQISDEWQEIQFSEAICNYMAKNTAIEKKVGINRQMENERNEQKKAINELKNIFDQWSEDIRFQLPSSFYLKPINEGSLNTICLVPQWFDVKNKILGHFQCDLSERRLCADNSLFCKFCKNLFVQFLQKNNDMTTVPKLEMHFMGTSFVVRFVTVPGFDQIPLQNFDGNNIRIIITQFVKRIRKLVDESFCDEAIDEKDEKKRREKHQKFVMMLEEELFETENDDNVARIMEVLEKCQTKTEINGNCMKEAKNAANIKRKKIEELKEILSVLWDHTIPLSLIEHLLTKKESFKLHHRHEENENVLNGNTLRRFRALYAFVELWAKEKNLFNESVGHLNSFVIMAMVTKVFVLFPGQTSISFLLEKFFLIYSLWDWPMPLQLMKKIDYGNEVEFMNWSPSREWFDRMQNEVGHPQIWTEMPIISPTFPHQNMANRIDPPTAKNIQNEFLSGFKYLIASKGTDLFKEL